MSEGNIRKSKRRHDCIPFETERELVLGERGGGSEVRIWMLFRVPVLIKSTVIYGSAMVVSESSVERRSKV